jgi:hypothetical protein
MSDMTDDIETLRRGNERLQVALAEANAVREACAQRAFRLEAEVERLRDELRQSSIDHTRAEVERLREALEIIAGYRPCIDSLMGNQDIAIAALRREGK